MLTYLCRFKCKKLLSGEEHVAERLVYSRFFDNQIGERSANGVDGLLAALEDKCIEVSMHAVAKAQASVQFRHKQGGGSPNPCVTDTCDTSGGKPRDKGPTASNGKAETEPDNKPKPRPHSKAEVQHETDG
jgi:hypothetical protein